MEKLTKEQLFECLREAFDQNDLADFEHYYHRLFILLQNQLLNTNVE